jgi:hypothetical protein
MKKKLTIIFLIMILSIGAFVVPEYLDIAIPRFRPFGSSTTFADSTNYVTLNKGFYVGESLRVERDFYVQYGRIYLDTSRGGYIYYAGKVLTITNSKTASGTSTTFDNTGAASNFIFKMGSGSTSLAIYKYLTGSTLSGVLLQYDTTLFQVRQGHISLLDSTQQIKTSTKTQTDDNSDDIVICNSQSGVLTTKALTTAAASTYTLTLTNSLISTSSNVLATLNWGTNTTAGAFLTRVREDAGGTTFIIYNGGAGALNGTMVIKFLVINTN